MPHARRWTAPCNTPARRAFENQPLAANPPSMSPVYELAPGEFIFAPFHYAGISGELSFIWHPRASGAPPVERMWDGVVLHWVGVDAAGEAGEFTFACSAPLRGGDELVCCLFARDGLRVAPAVTVDGAEHALAPGHGTGTRLELRRALPSGARLEQVTLRFSLAPGAGAGSLKLVWFALADPALRAAHEAARPRPDPTWPGLLRPDAEWRPGAPFRRGLLFAAADLSRLRDRVRSPEWAPLYGRLRARAMAAARREPEADVRDTLPFPDERYQRPEERGRAPFYLDAPALGLVALIEEDAALARHALRGLLCMLHTRHWTVSADCRMPSLAWDIRCFLEEMTVTACALLLDWFDAAITPSAKELAAVALWDRGLAYIERDLLRHDYVHRMNQGVWFSRGRMLGWLMLETYWPRAAGRAPGVAADLRAVLENYLTADGGAHEGVNYFSLSAEVAITALRAAERATGRPARDLAPPRLALSARYLSALSAVRPGTFLLDGDNTDPTLAAEGIPLLAALYPEGGFDALAAGWRLRAPDRAPSYFDHYTGTGLFALLLGPERLGAAATCAVPEFAILEATGQLTSFRRDGEASLRLHVIGAGAGATHTHPDRGSFLVEVDGEPFLIDRGMLRYDDARCPDLRRSFRHNVLTPVAADRGAFPDQRPARGALVPEGRGDERRLDVTLTLDSVWPEPGARHRRRIGSPDVNGFLVEDAVETPAPGRVAFHLNAPAPFVLVGPGEALLRIAGRALLVAAPWAESVSHAEDGVDALGRPVWLLTWTSTFATRHELRTGFVVERTMEQISP